MRKTRTIIKNRCRFFTFLLLMTICINIMLIYIYMPKNTQADAATKTQLITVCAGDTIWSIAEEHSNHTDIRNAVYEIKKLNGLKSGDLSIGQELLIPIN